VNEACRFAYDVGYCFSYSKNQDALDKFPCLEWKKSTTLVLYNMRRAWKRAAEENPELKEDHPDYGWTIENCMEYKAMIFSSQQSSSFDDKVSILSDTFNC